MFHAISGALGRLGRRIRDRRAVCFEYAAWHGWESRRTGPGTYRFRDPRFGQLAVTRTAHASSGRTWAQAATTARIRTLGTHAGHRGSFGRGA
jgi:hypothetical protein